MTKLTIEEFKTIHTAWQQNGQSVSKYCASIGMRERRFYNWKKRLETSALALEAEGFIPLKMTRSIQSSETWCEVVYPNGVTIRVTRELPLEHLRQMITLLS